MIEAARSLGYRPKHVEHMDQSIAALLGVGDGALPGMPSGRPRTKVLALSSPVHEYTDYTNYAAFSSLSLRGLSVMGMTFFY